MMDTGWSSGREGRHSLLRAGLLRSLSAAVPEVFFLLQPPRPYTRITNERSHSNNIWSINCTNFIQSLGPLLPQTGRGGCDLLTQRSDPTTTQHHQHQQPQQQWRRQNGTLYYRMAIAKRVAIIQAYWPRRLSMGLLWLCSWSVGVFFWIVMPCGYPHYVIEYIHTTRRLLMKFYSLRIHHFVDYSAELGQL